MVHTILEKDTDLIFSQFVVLKASAGSGKTHALTKRFVQFLLSDKIRYNNLRNMLAITFSNNAAKDMKKRILSWLKGLYLQQSVMKERKTTLVASTCGGRQKREGEYDRPPEFNWFKTINEKKG